LILVKQEFVGTPLTKQAVIKETFIWKRIHEVSGLKNSSGDTIMSDKAIHQYHHMFQKLLSVLLFFFFVIYTFYSDPDLVDIPLRFRLGS